MKKILDREFAERGIVRGGLLFLRPPDAIAYVRRCAELRVPVLGLDAVRLTSTATQPILEESYDATASGVKGNQTWAVAESFLSSREKMDLYFEVITPSK